MAKKVVMHTKRERLKLRHHKRKFGPAALRRAEKRKHLQQPIMVTIAVLDDIDPAILTRDGDALIKEVK